MKIRLVRTNAGKMIHTADCGQLNRCKTRPPVPWNWADDKNIYVIASAIAQFGYQICHTCQPVSYDLIIGGAAR